MKMNNKINAEKMIYLDGLRGVFCIVVIIHHFMMAFFPNSPQILYNDGNMAVMYFLLLSGFVMPLNIFKKNTKNDIKSIAKESCSYLKKRYIRLLPVVVSSIIISWFILIGGGYYTIEAGTVFNNPIIAEYYNFSNVPFRNVIYEALIGSFIHRPDLNTPLWTIRYEFFGLSIAYIIMRFLHENKYRMFVQVAVITCSYIVTRDIYFSVILIGTMLADLMFNQGKQIALVSKIRNSLSNKYIKIFLLFSAIILYVFAILGHFALYIRVWVAIVILLLCISSKKIQQLASHSVLLKISNISFEIYAIHWPIICSLSCYLIIKILPILGKVTSSLIVFGITLITILYCASILKLILRLINKFANVMIVGSPR